MYQTDVRVDAPVFWLTTPGRQNEWISSAFPAATGVRPPWFQPEMQNSQLPSLGVPDPPPTELAGSSATTVDWSAGGVFPNPASWENVPAHWLTTLNGTRV